jgi:hypothetical protein
MTCRFSPGHLRGVFTTLAMAGVALAGCSQPAGQPGVVTTPVPSYTATLPRPLVVAQGVSSANPAHRFRSQAWDFARMREVFDAVSLLPGDQATVREARRAGLAVVLESGQTPGRSRRSRSPTG